MFAVLRLLAIIAIVVIAYAGFRYARDRQPRWLSLIRFVLYSLLGLGLIFSIGLFVELLPLG